MKGVPRNRSSCFSRRHSSNPSISGIFVSERMRSGGEISHLSRASRPFTAVVTENPAFLSETSITRSDFGSPSTRSRCCFAKPSPFRAFSLGRVRGSRPRTARSSTASEAPRGGRSAPLVGPPLLELPELPGRVAAARVRLDRRAEEALGLADLALLARHHARDEEGPVAGRVLAGLGEERLRAGAVLLRGVEDERLRERRLVERPRIRTDRRLVEAARAPEVARPQARLSLLVVHLAGEGPVLVDGLPPDQVRGALPVVGEGLVGLVHGGEEVAHGDLEVREGGRREPVRVELLREREERLLHLVAPGGLGDPEPVEEVALLPARRDREERLAELG